MDRRRMGEMNDKCIVLVEFIFLHSNEEIEGSAALFFGKNDVIPMIDDDILKEIKVQYGYDVIRLLHKQSVKA